MSNKDSPEKFQKDSKFGMVGSSNARNRLTLRLLERFEMRNLDGISVEELMFDIAQDEGESSEMRFKAAAKLADLVFPKTAQVELEVNDESGASLEDMDSRIQELLSKAQLWEEKAPEDKD